MAEHLVLKGTFYEVGKQLVSVFICSYHLTNLGFGAH